VHRAQKVPSDRAKTVKERPAINGCILNDPAANTSTQRKRVNIVSRFTRWRFVLVPTAIAAQNSISPFPAALPTGRSGSGRPPLRVEPDPRSGRAAPPPRSPVRPTVAPRRFRSRLPTGRATLRKNLTYVCQRRPPAARPPLDAGDRFADTGVSRFGPPGRHACVPPGQRRAPDHEAPFDRSPDPTGTCQKFTEPENAGWLPARGPRAWHSRECPVIAVARAWRAG